MLCAAVFSQNVFAESAVKSELGKKSYLATQPDIVGQWKMVYQAVDPRIKDESPFFYDDQVWVFSTDGYVKNVAMSPGSTEDKSVYLNTMPKTATFSFPKPGLLKIERQPQDIDQIFVSVINKDVSIPIRPGSPLLQKGDLILSYMRASKKNPYMQRYLRRTEIKGVQP